MTTTTSRALVSGAGIGGLATAAFLAGRGVEVDIVEIRPDVGAGGIGISIPTNGLRMLGRLGVLDQCVDAGRLFDEYVMRDGAGGHIASMPCRGTGDVPGYLGIGRSILSGILHGAASTAGATLRLGVTIDEVEDTGHAARVRLSDGTEAAYDVVIGCEGLRSPLRARLFGPRTNPVFTGYSAWRTTPAGGRLVDAMTKYSGASSDAGLVPISDTECYLFLITSEPGDPYVEPVRRRDLLRDRLACYTGVVGEIRDALPDADEIVYSPLYEVHLPSPWYAGRAIVIGDAAHAVVPHLSQGGSQTLEDAVVLGEELTTRPPADAFRAFMARRFTRARYLQGLSADLLVREMTAQPSLAADRDALADELRREMATIREYLAQPV